ncbi:MAG: glycosyltransferase family 2 protein [Synergistaceae bacterium]|nr:glycosyltransferase family 2 protein [Synergistaceae bacterium]
MQSVIIPTYNRKNFLADAINSVLSQTQKSLEVIVIDDCSTDSTADFVKSIPDERIRYFRNEENSGQKISQMNGLRLARGKYITFLDDDDYYTDYEFFAKTIKIFEEHESDEIPIVMVCANAKRVNVQTNQTEIYNIGEPGRAKGLDYILGVGHTKPPSTFPAVFRADILRKAGLDNRMIFDEMTYINSALYGDGWFIPDVIGVYRVHGQNDTNGGYRSKNPEIEARMYKTITENMREWKHAAEVVQSRTDKHTADKLYLSKVIGLISWYAIARPATKDRIKTCICAMKVSGFKPKLWFRLAMYTLRHFLKKIFRVR